MQQHCRTQSFHHPWVSTPHRDKVHCESSNLCLVSLKDMHACDPQYGIWEVNSNTLQSEYKLMAMVHVRPISTWEREPEAGSSFPGAHLGLSKVHAPENLCALISVSQFAHLWFRMHLLVSFYHFVVYLHIFKTAVLRSNIIRDDKYNKYF